MDDFYINRKTSYKWPPAAEDLTLDSIGYTEIPMPVNASVPDPDDDAHTWVIQGMVMRYRFQQITSTIFTDVSTYAAQQRCIPRSPSHAVALAANVSKVSTAAAIRDSFLKDVAIGAWELVGHSIHLHEPGIYQARFILEATSGYMWDPSNFVKSKQKTEYQL